MVVEHTVGPDVAEHVPHQLDVDDVGHVFEQMLAGGQQGRHLLLEHGVLGPQD